MIVEVDKNQIAAINKLKPGSILCGGTGSGKSRTALVYYFEKVCGGEVTGEEYKVMTRPRDLYIITTAFKRDKFEWDLELSPFLLSRNQDLNMSGNKVIVDSWNNIRKYTGISGAFFIFDEQHLIGSGAWVKAFYAISKKNPWILLTATPGDTWTDYIPVFVANGFYKNKTEFIKRHVIFNRYVSYPLVDRYLETKRLIFLKNQILINLDYEKQTTSYEEIIYADYDRAAYYYVVKNHWDIFDDEPIANASKFAHVLRRLVFTSYDRIAKVKRYCEEHPKTIIFYNYNYELDLLKEWLSDLNGYSIAEHNGFKHESIPTTSQWIYLVQYNSGSEAWNCTTTDTMIFYSMNPSYKIMVQAAGRIDRRNTPFEKLYYLKMSSKSPLDKKLEKTLAEKRDFNEVEFFEEYTCPLIGEERKKENT